MAELTNSELALIGLTAEGPKYGYEIEGAIEARGMREWTEIGFSSIYYALNRLESAGLLASRRTESGMRPGRRIYELTPAGWQSYRAEVLRRLSDDRPRTSDFDLALANLTALEPDGQGLVRQALEARRRRLAGKLAEVEAKWTADGRGHLSPGVEALFDHTLMQLRAELAWLDGFLVRKLTTTNTQECRPH
jgi:DNA-binding PadR family transcriptional regulator